MNAKIVYTKWGTTSLQLKTLMSYNKIWTQNPLSAAFYIAV